VVFEGELVGILLALHLLSCLHNTQTALIALDNQVAILMLQGNKAQSAHYLLDHIHDAILHIKCQHHHLCIHFEWVLGHNDIKGNEMADLKAKAAAEGSVSCISALPPSLHHHLLDSLAAIKAHRKELLLQHWRDAWVTSPCHDKIAKIDSSLPSHKIYKMLSSLPCCATTIITQLHTGHVTLNAFLKKINAIDSALCKHCCMLETVMHYHKH